MSLRRMRRTAEALTAPSVYRAPSPVVLTVVLPAGLRRLPSALDVGTPLFDATAQTLGFEPRPGGRRALPRGPLAGRTGWPS